MTDDQWLRAIAKYEQDGPTLTEQGAPRGGASQLAELLGERTKQEAARFARLGLRIPTEANPVYLSRILIALRESTVDDDLKCDICAKAYSASRQHLGREIAGLLETFENPLPSSAIEMLAWLATEHPNPECEGWREGASGGGVYFGGDIYTNGINTTRGSAAGAIRKLIVKDAAYVAPFRATIDRMIHDQSVAALSCVAGVIGAVANHDVDLGMSLFHRTNLTEDRLLATPYIDAFIRHRLQDRFDDLEPLINRMLRASDSDVQEAGARMAALAVLHGHAAADLVSEALEGTAHHRLGLARVASTNIASSECRTWCEAQLPVLFNDDSREVRREAASCFGRLSERRLDTYADLISVFLDSEAFSEDSSSILRTLERSSGRLPGIVCVVCHRFLERFGREAADISTRAAADGHTVTKLIFRTYQQHQNDEWTVSTLTLIDRLCLDNLYGVQESFEDFER